VPPRDLVLVADDEPIVRLLVGRVLDQAGYRSIVVESALEALAVLESQHDRVSLVLTDVVMPERSGVELQRDIAERWPEIPVMFMSGYTPEELMRQGVPDTAGFIAKPFSIEELLQVLERRLEHSPLERRRGARVER
jgi:two-component system, cell cycle sensor histidine kinase and response regulator CckA